MVTLSYICIADFYWMNIYNKSTLNSFAKKYADAKKELELWYNDVSASHWTKPGDVTKAYRDASAVKNNRIVFKGTHAEYDRIDAKTVNQFISKRNRTKH